MTRPANVTHIREAIELATLIAEAAAGDHRLAVARIAEALSEDPVAALVAQATLSVAVARIAGEIVENVLTDPAVLRIALARAEDGDPLPASALDLSAERLFVRAGLGAAKLNG